MSVLLFILERAKVLDNDGYNRGYSIPRRHREGGVLDSAACKSQLSVSLLVCFSKFLVLMDATISLERVQPNACFQLIKPDGWLN